MKLQTYVRCPITNDEKKSVCIHSDLVRSWIVNNKFMPVLAVFSLIEVTKGKAYSPNFNYCQLMRKDFDGLEFYIQDFSGPAISFFAGVTTLKLRFRHKSWNWAGTAYVQYFCPSLHSVSFAPTSCCSTRPRSNGLRRPWNFFCSLARTAKHIIFPSLVRLGRNLDSDVLENKETLLDLARHRTMEAVKDLGARNQEGEGKRKRKKKAKNIVQKNKYKKRSKKVAKKPKRKRVKHSKKPHLSVAPLLE